MQLTEARGKLDKAVTLLGQFRDRHGDPAPRREATTSNGVDAHTPSRGDHHVRASHSPAKKSGAAMRPSARSTKTAAGGSASRPVSSGASPANRSQEKSRKRASGACLFVKILKPQILLYDRRSKPYRVRHMFYRCRASLQLYNENTSQAPPLLLYDYSAA